MNFFSIDEFYLYIIKSVDDVNCNVCNLILIIFVILDSILLKRFLFYSL